MRSTRVGCCGVGCPRCGDRASIFGSGEYPFIPERLNSWIHWTAFAFFGPAAITLALVFLGYPLYMLWIAGTRYRFWCALSAVAWYAVYYVFSELDIGHDRSPFRVVLCGVLFVLLIAALVRYVEEQAAKNAVYEERERLRRDGFDVCGPPPSNPTQ